MEGGALSPPIRPSGAERAMLSRNNGSEPSCSSLAESFRIFDGAARPERHSRIMAKSPLAGISILLLEDEVLLRKRLAGFLEKEGAEVTAVNTVAAARQALESLSFEAAVIDVNLPDGRGTDLLREKAFPTTTNVIVMTAEGGVAGAVEALRAGAADYLVKPFDLEELPVRLAQARRSRQAKRADEFRRGQETF